jgi:hypothetical protein
MLTMSCVTQTPIHKPVVETPLPTTTRILSSSPIADDCSNSQNQKQFQFSEEIDSVLQDSWYLSIYEVANGEMVKEILDYINDGGNVNCVLSALESYDREYYSLSPQAVWVDLNDSGFDDLILATSRGMWIFNCVSGICQLSLVHGFAYTFNLQIVKVEDVNDDEQVDLFISEDWIGSSNCELLLFIFTWDGKQFINLFNPGERLLPANNCPAEYEIVDLNEDNLYEIMVKAQTSKYDYNGPTTSFNRVYELDGDGYFRHAYTLDF